MAIMTTPIMVKMEGVKIVVKGTCAMDNGDDKKSSCPLNQIKQEYGINIKHGRKL